MKECKEILVRKTGKRGKLSDLKNCLLIGVLTSGMV